MQRSPLEKAESLHITLDDDGEVSGQVISRLDLPTYGQTVGRYVRTLPGDIAKRLLAQAFAEAE